MFRMIGDFKFDLENDCYVNNKNGVKLSILEKDGFYMASFRVSPITSQDYPLKAKTLFEAEREIEKIISSDIYYKNLLYAQNENLKETCKEDLQKIKEFYHERLRDVEEEFKTKREKQLKNARELLGIQKEYIEKYGKPKGISKEVIEKAINKSNAAEVLFLEKRVTDLENRVTVLEDSVEDLEEWRHS